MTRTLAHDQAELVHHVELADAGWQDRLWDQLVLSSVVVAGSRNESELVTEVGGLLGGAAGRDATTRAIKRLVRARSLLEVGDGRLAPSQSVLADAELRRARARQVDADAKGLFETVVAEETDALSQVVTWDWFCDRCLTPLITSLGARTHELLTNANQNDNASSPIGKHLDDIPPGQQSAARRAVERFLTSQNVSVREFVLRQLDFHLLSMAASLPIQSLDALAARAKSNIHLKILLDTNFLFSFLGLHDNPANEAAADLMALLATVKNRMRVTLYVSPLTVDEVRRTLTFYEAKLSQMAVTPRLAEAATMLGSDVSGITLKYFEAIKKAKQKLSVREYLGPYLEDLVTVLRGRGIELYNENTNALSQSQPVIDDILEQQSFEKKKYGERAKPYEALRHDVTLWHLAARQRPAGLDAPLDASFWIATVDYRLLGFDAYKRGSHGGSVPVCIHPTVLIQMLQFWLPRSPELEEALFDSLRTFLPHFVDSAAEEMSLKIIRALSRFENVDDLPSDAITSVLMNRALRGRLQGEREVEKQVALVRDAIIDESLKTRKALEAERARAEALEEELRKVQVNTETADKSSAETIARQQAETKQVLAALAAERLKVQDIAGKLETLESWAKEQREQQQRTRLQETERGVRNRCLGGLALLTLIVALAGWRAATELQLHLSIQPWKAITLAATSSLGVWMLAFLGIGKVWSDAAALLLYQRIRLAIYWIGATAWAVALSLITNVIWEAW
jgi:hypothetical protein